ncbi:inhibin beta C chain [Xenopus laevis]|uniref:Inhibin beta C chain n=1 Tax=Xenopus laevis TaxID=8355 RepID=A0A8J1MG50_XENLA|nr:inhibin beta C chain [Xenopus laevis]
MNTPVVLPLLLVTVQVSLSTSSSSDGSTFKKQLESQNEKKILLEMAKQNILNKLHLKKRPKISHTISREALAQGLLRLNIRSHEDLLSSIEQDDVLDSDQDYEVISFADVEHTQASQTTLHFHLSTEKGTYREIHNAALWLYLQSDRKKKIAIGIATSLSNEKSSTEMIYREIVRSGWYTVPLPMLTEAAFRDGEENIDLYL